MVTLPLCTFDNILTLDLVGINEKLQILHQIQPLLSPSSLSPLFLLQSQSEELSTLHALAPSLI